MNIDFDLKRLGRLIKKLEDYIEGAKKELAEIQAELRFSYERGWKDSENHMRKFLECANPNLWRGKCTPAEHDGYKMALADMENYIRSGHEPRTEEWLSRVFIFPKDLKEIEESAYQKVFEAWDQKLYVKGYKNGQKDGIRSERCKLYDFVSGIHKRFNGPYNEALDDMQKFLKDSPLETSD